MFVVHVVVGFLRVCREREALPRPERGGAGGVRESVKRGVKRVLTSRVVNTSGRRSAVWAFAVRGCSEEIYHRENIWTAHATYPGVIKSTNDTLYSETIYRTVYCILYTGGAQVA